MSRSAPLAGLNVLVCRPEGQGAGLCQAIAEAGGTVLSFPTLAITATAAPQTAAARLAQAGGYDSVIFVSANAVRYAQKLADNGIIPLISSARVAAIGAATAKALREAGAARVLVAPPPGDSEALAAMDEWQDMAGRRCLIVRGEGGREWLAETMRRRGAQVDYAEVYRRTLPDADPAPLLARWRAGQVHAAIITSGEILQNLAALIGGEGLALLRETPVVAVSERVCRLAQTMGIHRVANAAGASDTALVQALAALMANKAMN